MTPFPPFPGATTVRGIDPGVIGERLLRIEPIGPGLFRLQVIGRDEKTIEAEACILIDSAKPMGLLDLRQGRG